MNENGKVAEASRLCPNNDTNPFYNPWAETKKNQGAHLPHWQQDGVLYFITFRLADSLPQEKLKISTQEKEVWLNQNPEPHNSEQKAEYYERFVMRIQQWLDLGYESMILRDKEAKSLVTNAFRHFDGERYKLDEYVVAANHAHVLLQVQKGHNLSDILHSWKSFTAKELLKLPVSKKLTTAPKVWQKESWDHIVRSEHSLQKFREYIQAHSS